MDCDVVVSLGPGNLSKLALALAPLSPTFRHKSPPESFDEVMAGKGCWKNIYLDTSAGVLDCLGEVKGLGGFAECRSQSLKVDLGGFLIRVPAREALWLASPIMGGLHSRRAPFYGGTR